MCEYFQTVALFEMLCLKSDNFPEAIDPKFRMPHVSGNATSYAETSKLRHQADSLLTYLVNAFVSPNLGITSHQVMYDKLLEFISFCKYNYSIFDFLS